MVAPALSSYSRRYSTASYTACVLTDCEFYCHRSRKWPAILQQQKGRNSQIYLLADK